MPEGSGFPISKGAILLAGAPEGADARALVFAAREAGTLLHVARDDARMDRLVSCIRFFGPDVDILRFPAWDCLPYDRVSPNQELISERAATLSRLANDDRVAGPRIVVTTVSAILQKLPPPETFRGAAVEVTTGGRLDVDTLLEFCTTNGFHRVGTVREAGEVAVRGGILDIFPPSASTPVRLDLFGDTVEEIKTFDPVSQRSIASVPRFEVGPVGELILTEDRVLAFREAYRGLFGDSRGDPLYEAISAGHAYPGMEHWLPLFYADPLVSFLDYLSDAPVSLDHQAEAAISSRHELLDEYYDARLSFLNLKKKPASGDFLYKPVPPDRLYLSDDAWQDQLTERAVASLSPFAAPHDVADTGDAGARPGRDFSEVRASPDSDLFDAVRSRIGELREGDRRIVISALSKGTRERLASLLEDNGVRQLARVETWTECEELSGKSVALAVLPLERGFVSPEIALITEQDILGDRLIHRARRQRKRSDAFLTEISSLDEGDYVVHVDHGIGQYDGLETVTVGSAPHDCLRLIYDGGDKLFLPVENMEMLSRYGAEDSGAQLDRLGGAGWQSRKARIKARVREIADKLLAIAAQRELKDGAVIQVADGLYESFAARFPFEETDDQARAIADVLADLSSGRPMDRLVCGDVGFGKTEVALRAAFAAVMDGKQVAVVVPTTLLARQHHKTFCERFEGTPVNIGRLSRLVSAKEAADTRKALARGEIDIVVGTHALLGSSVQFRDLGLLIVDEEQHFGVKQKERLKELRADVHILTLTATPIPRTLQMALAGVRDMSLIATPPVDRLAVRTFVTPFDPVVIREAIQRELFRGGQIFYVCPRIDDLAGVAEQVQELIPDVRYEVAHGQMSPTELEAVMTRFYAGEVQVLIATNIIESGLDIPTVNTILIHRADRFGLAQLYQLRGRVGRSKTRAYAYLTLPTDKPLTPNALRRLEVMQTLDTLGAGFSLASHDMDIRGAGNLLGEEQSGQIREVGIELYQQMLEEAVARARDNAGQTADADPDEVWTPQIAIGTPVLIPDHYVEDLSVRLGLYRRISQLVDREDIDAFADELVDRFGQPPQEVKNLLDIIALKRLCHRAGVAKVDAGPKGAVVAFYKDDFANPAGLVAFVAQEAGTAKLRPDHKLVYRRKWDEPATRVKGLTRLMTQLAEIGQQPR